MMTVDNREQVWRGPTFVVVFVEYAMGIVRGLGNSMAHFRLRTVEGFLGQKHASKCTDLAFSPGKGDSLSTYRRDDGCGMFESSTFNVDLSVLARCDHVRAADGGVRRVQIWTK